MGFYQHQGAQHLRIADEEFVGGAGTSFLGGAGTEEIGVGQLLGWHRRWLRPH